MPKDYSASPADRLPLTEAAVWLAIARLTILLLPFRLYSRVLGRPMTDSPLATDDGGVPAVISGAIDAATNRVPWTNKCLEQAFAAKMMLRRRGLSNTLYLAVARDITLEAHAWVRSGSVCVTGQADFDRYTIVARFADEGT